MDPYKGRKGPNVSHYLANLNTLPSAHDIATQQQEDFNIEDELAQFTNTNFYDFDPEGFVEQQMPDYDPSLEEKARRETAAANQTTPGKDMDYVTGMLYTATTFNNATSSTPASTEDQLSLQTSMTHR